MDFMPGSFSQAVFKDSIGVATHQEIPDFPIKGQALTADLLVDSGFDGGTYFFVCDA